MGKCRETWRKFEKIENKQENWRKIWHAWVIFEEYLGKTKKLGIIRKVGRSKKTWGNIEENLGKLRNSFGKGK